MRRWIPFRRRKAEFCFREYLQHVADQRLAELGIEPLYGSANPRFMGLQDMQELSNFFERRVSAYQLGVTGDVAFDQDF